MVKSLKFCVFRQLVWRFFSAPSDTLERVSSPSTLGSEEELDGRLVCSTGNEAPSTSNQASQGFS